MGLLCLLAKRPVPGQVKRRGITSHQGVWPSAAHADFDARCVQRISFLVHLRVVSVCTAGSMIASFDVRNVPDVARLTECTLDRPLSPITNDGTERVDNRRRD